MDSERKAGLIQLRSDIDRAVATCLMEPCALKAQHDEYHGECSHLARVGHYFQEISRASFWPTSMISQDGWCIKTVGAKVAMLDTYYQDDEDGIIKPPSCGDAAIDFDDALMEAVEKAGKNQKGLCLVCVKNGRVTKQDGNCYARESDLCTGKDSS